MSKKKETPNEKVNLKAEKPGKKIEVPDKVHKPEPKEEKKEIITDRSVNSRESKNLNTSHLTNTSGIASLPDNNEDAANVYVDHLLESVQKHIIAST